MNFEALGGCLFVGLFWLAMAVIAVLLFAGCASPKTIEQHHHHYAEVDSEAVQAIVDQRLTTWDERITDTFQAMVEAAASEQHTDEQSRERITETMTTYIDSLGREVRQQQRTTERSLSRQQQQREQQLTQHFERRLQQELSQRDSLWQLRFDAMQAHWQQEDSAHTEQVQQKQPNRLGQWLGSIAAAGIILIIVAVLWLTWRKK